jgi:hypothetical protein
MAYFARVCHRQNRVVLPSSGFSQGDLRAFKSGGHENITSGNHRMRFAARLRVSACLVERNYPASVLRVRRLV